MNAHSSHRQAPVDDRDFLAHFRCANRALLPRRTTSNNYQIVFVSLHKCSLRCSTKLALFFLRAEGTFGIGFKIKSPLTMCNVWRGRPRPRTPSHLIVIPTLSESRRGEICSSPQNADSLHAERNHRPPARTSSLLQFRQQLRFQVVRVNDHLAGGNLFVGRPVKTQLADSQAAFCPHGRAKRAAHHRPGIVEIAQSGIRIEHRTRLIVRKLCEALFRLRTFVEYARFRVAGKLRRQPPNRRPRSLANTACPLRVRLFKVSQPLLQPDRIQSIDGKHTHAALRASRTTQPATLRYAAWRRPEPHPRSESAPHLQPAIAAKTYRKDTAAVITNVTRAPPPAKEPPDITPAAASSPSILASNFPREPHPLALRPRIRFDKPHDNLSPPLLAMALPTAVAGQPNCR